MSDLVEYFVRHYTLVLDNDQSSYNDVREAVQKITRASDITVSQYRAMSASDRMMQFGTAIGEEIMELIDGWYFAAIAGRDDSLGGSLIREIMITSDSSITWGLADHYMPEDSEADEFFSDDDSDDE